MISRLFALALAAWALGFALFAVTLPRAGPTVRTDGIVVLTGGPGRIERGLVLMKDRRAERMLVSGVGRQVKPMELAASHDVPRRLIRCCIDLGYEAVDTRSNAAETAEWIAARNYRTVRLVTTDWHMPRARAELARAIAGDVRVLPDAVSSRPSLDQLFTEYHKYLVSRAAGLVGL